MIHEYRNCKVTAFIIDGTFDYEILKELPNQKELELFIKASNKTAAGARWNKTS
jgi:hypothetical protein